jgi:hypothetical protein
VLFLTAAKARVWKAEVFNAAFGKPPTTAQELLAVMSRTRPVKACDLIADLRLTIEPTLILFPFTQARADVRTIAFVKRLMEMGERVLWLNVESCPKIGYGLCFSSYWHNANRDGQDLIIIEHDVLPSLRMLWEMSLCPHPVCAQSYYIHPASTKLEGSVYCQCAKKDFGDRWIRDKPFSEWVTFSGFGFIRFRHALLSKVQPSIGNYQGLDFRFCIKAAETLGDDFIHVHRPEMEHFHGELV